MALKEIARLSKRGVEVVVEGSTLSIPIDKPATAVSAIDTVVDQACRRTP